MNEVNTWENLSRKEQLEETVWDMYKEAYGIRPRHRNLTAMSEDELDAMYQNLQVEIDRAEKDRHEAEAQAVTLFSKRVEDTIKSGAKDRETALRWIHEADGTNGDDEYLCYLNCLPYGFFKAAA